MHVALVAAGSKEEAHPVTARGRWLILSVVAVGTFMAVLDGYIVNVALPTIQSSLKANAGELELVIASYSLVYAIFLITEGRLGDIFGRKKMFLLGMTIFTIGSAMSGLSPTPELLLVFRAIQGFGAATMYPQILSIIQVTFKGGDRQLALGIFAGVNGVAQVIAQLFGGFLIHIDLVGLSWRAIFLVNVPIGIGGVIAGLIFLRESKNEPPPKLDLPGAGLIALLLVSIVLPLVEGLSIGWPIWIIGLLVLSLPFLIIFVLYERRVASHNGFPLVNLKLFKQRSFSVGFPLALLFFSTNGGLFYLIAIFLQRGLGFSPLASGLTFTPISFGLIVASLSAQKFVKRFGRYTLSLGFTLAAVGLTLTMIALRLYGTGIDNYDLLFPFLVSGLGFGFANSPLVGTVLAGVKSEDTGTASGLMSTAIQLGISVGVGLYGMIFYALADSSKVAALSAQYLYAFELTLVILTSVEIAGFLMVFFLPKPATGQVKDIFLERLPGPLSGLAYSLFFNTGGRIGKPLFDEMLEEATERRSAIDAPPEDFAAYMVNHFLETNEERPEWIHFLTREALDSKGDFESLKEEREKVIRQFVENIRNRQEKGFLNKDIDPEYLTLMVLSLSFYPRVFEAVTKTITKLSSTDKEFEKHWSELLREVAKAFESKESEQNGTSSNQKDSGNST
jgi:EmrB/QacA subfamily drug resistance transporter